MKFLIFIAVLIPSLSFAHQEDIRRTVKENLKEMRACYQEFLNRSPTAKGKVVLTWNINDEGNVTKTVINEKSTTLKDADLHNCMTQKLKLWKFPPAPKGETVEVNYPFMFSPKE